MKNRSSPHQTQKQKPLLRGHFHQAFFFLALGAIISLFNRSLSTEVCLSLMVYSITLITLLGTSSLYHRINWKPKARSLMKRLDHSAIYLFIAGSITPISTISMPASISNKILTYSWLAAALGIIFSVVWTSKPKWLTAILAIAAAFTILPFLPEIISTIGIEKIFWILLGGVIYICGALAYATKRPNPFPKIFGYHEVFHLCVIIGAGIHFGVIQSLLTEYSL